jgi:hypothetical protein
MNKTIHSLYDFYSHRPAGEDRLNDQELRKLIPNSQALLLRSVYLN